MRDELLWDTAERIVQELRDEITRNGRNCRGRRADIGWQYAGPAIEESLGKVVIDMAKKKYKVLGCTGFHFIKIAKIQNPMKRYISIPIRGTPTLNQGGTLSESYLYFIDDEPILEAEDRGTDILCIILKGKNGEGIVRSNAAV